MGALPEKFENVSVACKANVFFDAKVVSHTIFLPDGSRKTLGLIYPGAYEFDTKAAEEMAITAGTCRVKLRGQKEFVTYTAGGVFKVPANSAFEIAVDQGLTQYICSFE
ncbi:MAG: pyrimidine/purine nucleoside phosphorylase [Phycisphaerae bacterium]|jgi:hypothetical protein